MKWHVFLVGNVYTNDRWRWAGSTLTDAGGRGQLSGHLSRKSKQDNFQNVAHNYQFDSQRCEIPDVSGAARLRRDGKDVCAAAEVCVCVCVCVCVFWDLSPTLQHTDPDYSVAYVVLDTDCGLKGFGLTFTVGKGTEIGKIHMVL